MRAPSANRCTNSALADIGLSSNKYISVADKFLARNQIRCHGSKGGNTCKSRT